jgi:hypothetical protein
MHKYFHKNDLQIIKNNLFEISRGDINYMIIKLITMKKTLAVIALFTVLLSTSCTRHIKSSMGGSTDVVLNKNSDEYTIKRLNSVELEGNALFGIPGFGTNNKNKNKTGMIFKLNGVTIGTTPRILPILSMLAFTVASGAAIQEIGGRNENFQSNRFLKPNIPLAAALALGVPVGGILNNAVWSGNAASGLTNQVNYRLVDENPNVDIFTNPKYKIDYKHGLFNQKASIKADVMGATLKLK